ERVTVPANVGHVQVTGWVAFPSACTVCRVELWRNDVEAVAYSYGSTANTGFGDTWFTAFAPVISAQAGDYFTVRTYQNTGGSLTAFTQLSMLALGPPLGPGPTITTVNPTARGVGQQVTIAGFHFGATQGGSTVRLAGWTGD